MIIGVVSFPSSSLPPPLPATGAEVGVPVFTSIKVKVASMVGVERTKTVEEVTVVDPAAKAKAINFAPVVALVNLLVSKVSKAAMAAAPSV